MIRRGTGAERPPSDSPGQAAGTIYIICPGVFHNLIVQGGTSVKQSLFRQKSVDRISSPEQLDDYLHVTSPALWVVLCAVAALLIGLLIWSSVTAVESYAVGTAEVHDGILTVTFQDERQAKNVIPDMNVTVGELVTPILSVGKNEEGRLIAVANADIPDGEYDVKVGYKRTQIIQMLFN